MILRALGIVLALTGHCEAQYRVDVLSHGAFCGSPENDATPALIRAANAALAAGYRDIGVPPCSLYFRTPPPAFIRGFRIHGVGKSFSALVRAYRPATATEPFLRWNGSSGERGGGLFNLGITTEESGGIAVSLVASATGKPDYFEMEHVFISSRGSGQECGTLAGCWHQVVSIDGSRAPGGGSMSQGIRNLFMSDVYMFNATAVALTCFNCGHARLLSIFTTPSFAGSTGAVSISGGTDPNTDSSLSSLNVKLEGVIGGNLSVQNTNGFIGTGVASSVTIKPTTKNVKFNGAP